MILHLGSNKFKIYFNGHLCKLNLLSDGILLSGIQLLSSDNLVLRDSNGLYITVKESE